MWRVGQKWAPRSGQSFSRAKNGQKWARWPKMAKNVEPKIWRWPKMAKNVARWPKMGPKIELCGALAKKASPVFFGSRFSNVLDTATNYFRYIFFCFCVLIFGGFYIINFYPYFGSNPHPPLKLHPAPPKNGAAQKRRPLSGFAA